MFLKISDPKKIRLASLFSKTKSKFYPENRAENENDIISFSIFSKAAKVSIG